MSRYSTFISHETWWNAVRMNYHMHRNLLGISMVLWLGYFGLMVFLSSELSQFYGAALVFLWDVMSSWISGDSSFAFVRHSFKKAAWLMFEKGKGHLLVGGVLSLSFYIGMLKFFQRKSKSQKRPTHIRGAELKTVRQLNEETSKKPSSLTISDVVIPKDNEVLHTLVVGSTGSGKTRGWLEPKFNSLMDPPALTDGVPLFTSKLV